MIKITAKDFSVEKIVERMKSPEIGAIVCFLGTVRANKVKLMKVECYEEFAKKELENLELEAKRKFNPERIYIVHRIGKLKVSDNIILIAVGAKHRAQAFKACGWLIDELKKVVPIWKEELR